MQTNSWHHKLFHFHLSFLNIESVEAIKHTATWDIPTKL